MDEYIKRQEIRDALYDADAITMEGVKILNQFLAADVEPVVRCAQCNHFKRNLENDTYCSSVNGLTDPQEDDFCSYGERKDGESDE